MQTSTNKDKDQKKKKTIVFKYIIVQSSMQSQFIDLLVFNL